MPLNNPIVDFKFKVPEHVKKQLDVDVKLLKRLPADYKDIFYPSMGNKIGKFFSSKEKTKFNDRKKILQYELQGIQKEVNEIYFVYYEDEDTRKRCKVCFNTINNYCEHIGFKIPSQKNDFPGSATIMNVLKVIRGIAKGLQGDLQKVREIKVNIEQQEVDQKPLEEVEKKLPLFKKSVKKVAGLGVDTRKYDEMISQLNEKIDEIRKAAQPKGKDDIAKALQEYATCDKEYDKLVAQLKEPNWKELDESFKKLLDRLIQLSGKLKELATPATRAFFQASQAVNSIAQQWEAINKEVLGKIEFAEAMKNYYVFDWNMGVKDLKKDFSTGVMVIRKFLKDLKGEKVLNGPQLCLPIAKGEKELKQQYDHIKGDSKIPLSPKGPYYILVDNTTKGQVTEQYNNGFGKSGTINKSSDEKKALAEVDEYLKKALKAGTFDSKKFEPKLSF